MGLIEKLSDYVGKTRATLSTNKGNMRDYLVKYGLKDYFGDGFLNKKDEDLTDDEKKLKGGLERKLDDALSKYDKELSGWIGRKGISKSAMGLAILNDVYGYVSNVPFVNVSGLAYGLFAVKSIAEISALYRYVRKSHDYYGAIKHILLKVPRYLTPIVGPALESGAFDRMIRRRILKEVKEEFVKEFGKYEKLDDRLKYAAKKPLKDVLEFPTQGKMKKAA